MAVDREQSVVDSGQTPKTGDSLEFLRSVMRDPEVAHALRIRAAIAIAQYEHTKTHDGGKKDAKQESAKAAARGKFAPAAPPKLAAAGGKLVSG